MAKTYVIADIHGRADLLRKAVQLILADIEIEHDGKLPSVRPMVIVLGDFIDRGPDSAKVVATLRALNKEAGWRVLQGNHEAMAIEVMADPTEQQLRWWMGNGGDATLASYKAFDGNDCAEKLASDLQWMAKLPKWIGDKHRIYVHAGVPADTPIGEAKDASLQWMLYGGHDDEPENWEDVPHCSGKHIVHGHHQHMMNPHRHMQHRTNLDSHAYFSNRLAIGVFDDDIAGGPVRVLDAIAIP